MTANDTVRHLDELIARSNRLGADRRNTNYGGGNTSAKGRLTDPASGDEVEVMWVKGSGGDLGTLTADGLSVLELDRDTRAPRCVRGRGPRGRDAPTPRLRHLRAPGRCPEHRHLDARPPRGRARRSPSPRFRDRAGGVLGRRGADQALLRRRGRLGCLEAPGLRARRRNRGVTQSAARAARRRHGWARAHGLGRQLGLMRVDLVGADRPGDASSSSATAVRSPLGRSAPDSRRCRHPTGRRRHRHWPR